MSTDESLRKNNQKIINRKLSYFQRQEINKIFSVIYEMIEREKLNKMSYLHIIFRCAIRILLVKYCRLLRIFLAKAMRVFYRFTCHSLITRGPKLILGYVVQLILLYKMVKIMFEKNHRLGVKMASQCWPNAYYF